MEIWTGVTDASLTDSLTKDIATQLLIKYKSGALVTQKHLVETIPKAQTTWRVFFFTGFTQKSSKYGTISAQYKQK